MGVGIQRYDCVRFTPSPHIICIFNGTIRFLKAAVEARYRVRTMIRGEGWQYRLGSSLHNITEMENAGVIMLLKLSFISHNSFFLKLSFIYYLTQFFFLKLSFISHNSFRKLRQEWLPP
jgi:hypothetical protein